MSEIRTESVTLTLDDGAQMGAYSARPIGEGPFPGIVVLQEAFGVNAHIRDMVARFALQGFVALAPELFHRTAPGFQGDYTDFAAVAPNMQALNDADMTVDLRAAHLWLAGQGCEKSAAVGYCMGGRAAFLAAATLPLSAAVSYYGGGIAPGPRGPGLLGLVDKVMCPLLFFWGGLDKHIGPETIRAVEDALTAREKEFINVVISMADHGFFCDERASFSADAAAIAWPTTLAFLRLHLN
ncbi:MAG: dienelactone hydrolase family protein [Fimbriimonadaceae bacterium]